MLTDLFSSFDPAITSPYFLQTPIWCIPQLILLTLTKSFWASPSRFHTFIFFFSNKLDPHLLISTPPTFKLFHFCLIVHLITLYLLNIIGIIPYTTPLTSHLVFTLSLAIPFWSAVVTSSIKTHLKKTLANFTPARAPTAIAPFLVLVETTRTLVRPITLSFRLAANITIGHVTIALIRVIGIANLFTRVFWTIGLIFICLCYTAFEIFVAFLQAYIFNLLVALYTNDHP